MTAQQAVQHHSGSDEWQRNKGHADTQTHEILGQGRTDLSTDGRAGVHHQCDQDVDITFECVGHGAVTGRNHDFKKIGPDRDMRRDSEQVNETRHPDITGAATQKPTEKAAHKSHSHDCPNRYARNT